MSASQIYLQVLGGLSEVQKEALEEKKMKLIYKTLTAKPKGRKEKGAIIWDELTVEAAKIPDERGVDNKIELFNSETDQPVRTPWYYIPNIIDDFEISQKLGYNAALLLLNQISSRGKGGEKIIP